MAQEKETDKTVKKDEKAPKSLLSYITGGDRIITLVVIAGVLGIALIYCSTVFRPQQQTVTAESSDEQSDELQSYRNSLCEELGNMLASMDGVGRTKVMITLSGTERNIYATDTDYNDRETSRKDGNTENADKQNNEKRSCIVIRQKDGSEKALTVGRMMPQIMGVLVVCEGADNEGVAERVTKAVCAALNIGQTHVCVSKLNT